MSAPPPASPSAPSLAHATRLRIGDLRIDCRYRRIERPDGQVELPLRMFELLQVFLAEPGVLLTREELFRRVWAGVVVEDANLSQSVWVLRRALGESRKDWIRTVPKRGYVFEPPSPVEIETPGPSEAVARIATADTGDVAANAAAPLAESRATDGWAIEAAAAPPSPEATAATRSPAVPDDTDRTRRPSDSASSDTPPERTPQRRAPPGTAPAMRLMFGRLMFGLLCAGCLLWILSLGGSSRPRAQPAHPPTVAVMLLQAQPGAADVPHWPADLLEEWLSWKLDLTPEAVRLDATMAIDPRRTAPGARVVLIALRRASNDDTLILEARIGRIGDDRHDRGFVRRGRASEMPALIDALSNDVLAALVPARAGEVWPALALSPADAARYARAAEAMRRRDWPAAQADTAATIAAAPQFGPAFARMAEIDLRFGKTGDALAHLVAARARTLPLPADAARILDARIASVDPKRGRDALDAWAALARAHPARDDFALALARLLNRAGRPQDALRVLSDPALDGIGEHGRAALARQPSLRVRRWLALAETELALGSPARARGHAQRALALILQGGPGWEQELGAARMLLGAIHHGEPGARPSPQLFELAARAYDASGDRLSALYARAMVELAQEEADGTIGDGATPRMLSLLEQARALGYAGLEIELLRRTAYRERALGRHAAYRASLQQALMVANASGDLELQHLLEMDLLVEDMMIGNHASASARIARLRANGYSDGRAAWIDVFDEVRLFREGALDEIRRRARDDGPGGRHAPRSETDAAMLACQRVDALAASGDAVGARALLERCKRLDVPQLRMTARLLEAGLDLLDADRAQAQVLLDGVEADIATLPDQADRLLFGATAAALLTRSGDRERAARLHATLLPQAEAAGYTYLVSGLQVGLAELAAQRRDWPTSRRHADLARRGLPSGEWWLSERLDALEIVEALDAGDLALARTRRDALRARAMAIGDRIVVAELDSLGMAPRGLSTDDARTASASDIPPLPGATLDWLLRGPAVAGR